MSHFIGVLARSEGDLQRFLMEAYAPGSLDKILICSFDMVAEFKNEPEFGWGMQLPEPIVNHRLPHRTAIILDHELYEALSQPIGQA